MYYGDSLVLFSAAPDHRLATYGSQNCMELEEVLKHFHGSELGLCNPMFSSKRKEIAMKPEMETTHANNNSQQILSTHSMPSTLI